MAKVALLLPDLSGGGAERVFIDLARGLAETFDIDLVVGARRGALRDAVPSEIRMVDLRSSRMISALPQLRSYLREQRPDAVLSAITHANAVAAVACRSLAPRIPLVVTHHNTLSQVVSNTTVRRDRWSPLIIRLSYPRADRVVAVSQGVAADLSRRAKVAAGR